MFFKKNFFGVFGWAFITLSLCLLGYSMVNFLSGASSKDLDASRDFAMKNCVKVHRSLKIPATSNDRLHMITVDIKELDNWEQQLGIASVAMSSCKGLNLLEFCQGNDCVPIKGGKLNGLRYKLKYQPKIK